MSLFNIMQKSKFFLALIVFFCQFFTVSAVSAQNKEIIGNLRCEYLTSPIGIDEAHPRFTWEITDEKVSQRAFVLQVASSAKLLKQGKPDIWNSGLIPGAESKTVYNGKALAAHSNYFYRVGLQTQGTKKLNYSKISTFATAKMQISDWQAEWITDEHNKDYEPAPLFRKTFDLKGKVKQARLYVSGLGYYEMFLNGARVGKNYLDPGYTHFDKRVLYSTHDVTSLLSKGQNSLATVLGNGWFNCQSVAVWNFHEAGWRNRPQMIAELHIVYSNGDKQIVKTDESWKTNTGANIYNNIYSGDIIDARLDESGWKLSAFDDKHWKTAQKTNAPAPLLQSQTMPAIQVTKELRPVNVTAFSDSLYVFDMGENFTGLCRLRVKGEKGTVITMKHGELLKKNGRLEQGNINVYYKPKQKKEIFQTDVFILNGDQEEVFTPAFSYHGFQYVEIHSTKPVKLTADDLTGLFMHSNLSPKGSFSCSDETLNKIWKATVQSYKSNVHSIPTDCPQREKNGWTADAHVTMDFAMLNFDAISFYEKWMNDFIDNQRADGGISGIIPSAGWGYGEWPGPVWDAALFIVPAAIYNYYGDSRMIERLYPTFEKYLSYLERKEKNGKITFGIGDWVFYKAKTPTDFTSMCYYYLDYVYMAQFAGVLGKDATPFQKKADKLREMINSEYLNQETNLYANGTQAAQAVALYLNIVPVGKEQAVADNLVKMIRENNHFLDFGLLGSKTVLRMLTKYGYADDTLKMIVKSEAPSWGYWMNDRKYSTLPETWVLSPQFSDASLNHVFLGDVSAWMVNDIAGINYNPQKPGFQEIIIKPEFISQLDYSKAEYQSVKGLICSEWKRTSEAIELTVIIPANCKATVHADGKRIVGAGKHSFRILQK